ncbi:MULTISPECIES: hypothetical protein [Liquorilactobacillus]
MTYFVDSRNLGVMIKFMEPQHADSFLKKGEIHFTPLKCFAELEKEKKDHVFGDRNEGEFLYKFKQSDSIKMALLDEHEKIESKIYSIKPKNAELKVGLNESDKQIIGISSFTYFSLEDDYYLVSHDIDKKQDLYLIKPEVIEWLKRFNKDNRELVAIYDYQKLLNKAKENNIDYSLVNYYENDLSELEHQKNYYENAFVKRKRYDDQREFRFAIRLRRAMIAENRLVGETASFAKKIDYKMLSHLAIILDHPTYEKND